ncbi:MAG: phosphoribosylglycinamide formyltransferase [Pseudomonadota bacterium]
MTRKQRVAILISGSGSNMVALVKSMQDQDHPAEPVLVLSNRPDAGGLEKAEALGVPTAVVDHKDFGKDRRGFDAAMGAELDDHGVDLIALAGFMRIMTDGFVESWAGRMLNIHPSILPLFKGLRTHQRALDEGMAVHGCTVHEVTPQLDEGAILGQAVVPVRPEDTAETLALRVLMQEHRLYPAVLRAFVKNPVDARANKIALADPDF